MPTVHQLVESRIVRLASVGLVSVVLLVAVALQFCYRLRETPRVFPRIRLAHVVPSVLDGWRVMDEPLGRTEAVSSAALKILNLDDYVYRRFQERSRSFTVYAAYWAPGKMPTRLVASHTPDRCWTESGLRCVEMRFREEFRLGDRKIQPAEYRVFAAGDGGEKTFVVYWHLVEGKVYDYGGRFNAVPHPWLWWKDMLAQAVYGSREQVFVRITSTTPMRELWDLRGFQSVMASLADAGIAFGAR